MDEKDVSFELIMREGPQPGQEFALSGETVTLGRHRSNDIAIVADQISRHHARLISSGSGYAIEDLGSTNGTYVNGERISGIVQLHDGDEIRLGGSVTLAYVAMAIDMRRTVVAPGAVVLPEQQAGAAPLQRPVIKQAGQGEDEFPLSNEEQITAKRPLVWSCLAKVSAALGVIATCAGLATFAFIEGPELVNRIRYNVLKLPAPPPCEPASGDEVLIIVADFEQEGVKADTRIYRSLTDRIAESGLQGVRVQRVEGVRPESREAAVDLGESCNATLVIWGFADDFGIEPKYEIVRNQEVVYAPRSVGQISADDVPTFRSYVAEDVPNQFEYLMLFTLGQLAYFKADYARAISLFDEALEIELGDHAADMEIYLSHYYRGSAYLVLEQYDPALQDLSAAVALNPSHDLSFYGRGYAYVGLGNFEAALADFDAAVELKPDESIYYLDRGWAYSRLERFQEAIADWNRAIELNPDYALAYNNRAYTSALMGADLNQALADVNHALELDSSAGSYYDTRGYIYYRLNNYAAALEDFNKALELGETFAYYGRGLVFEAGGETQKAVDDYTHFLALYPDVPPQSDDARQRLAALGG